MSDSLLTRFPLQKPPQSADTKSKTGEDVSLHLFSHAYETIFLLCTLECTTDLHVAHEDLIRAELKRCADEIASVDLSMQTIRDIIRKSMKQDNKKEHPHA